MARLLFTLFILLFANNSFAMSSEEIAAIAKPSVVRIGVRMLGKMRVPQPIFNAQAGEYEPGVEILEDPVSTIMVGTGFVVNPSGYIITNAHVVDVSIKNVEYWIGYKYANQLYDRLNRNLPPEVTQEELNSIYKALIRFVARHGEATELQYDMVVFNPAQKEGTFDEFIDKGFQIDVKKMGQPFPEIGKDIAVLKIHNDNFPILKLRDTKKVKEGSKIYVVGYPSIADLNQAGTTEPSFTSGVVSAVKKSSQGDYNVIQIDAAISGGNSGGPVFNENGEVIGIATFKAYEDQGFNWILPIDLAREYLQELNIQYTTASDGLFGFSFHSIESKLSHLPLRTLLIGVGGLLILLLLAIVFKRRKS